MTTSLNIAAATVVEAERRGKLGGLVMAAESLGRFVGPASFATIFAWSITVSPEAASGGNDGLLSKVVDYHFVFFFPAIMYGLVSVLSRRSITSETLKISPPSPPRGEGHEGST